MKFNPMKTYIDEVWRQAKKRRIKSWIEEEHPDEFGYEDMDDYITFKELYDYLILFNYPDHLMDIDSEVRETVFNHLSKLYDVEYDVIYHLWRSKNTFEFVKSLEGKIIMEPED